MPLCHIKLFGEVVVESTYHLVYHTRQCYRKFYQSFCSQHVYKPDSCHHRSTVGKSQSLAEMNPQRFYPHLPENVFGLPPTPIYHHFAFAHKAESKVCQLHQVARCSYAAVFINDRCYIVVYQNLKQLYRIGMYARISLQKGVEPCKHYCLRLLGR